MESTPDLNPEEAAKRLIEHVVSCVFSADVKSVQNELTKENERNIPGVYERELNRWYKQLDAKGQEAALKIVRLSVDRASLAYLSLLDGTTPSDWDELKIVMQDWDCEEEVTWSPAKAELHKMYRAKVDPWDPNLHEDLKE